MFAIGTAFTFVVHGRPVALTRWHDRFDVRPSGSISSSNAADIGGILQVVLDTRRPVTLLLEDPRVIDEPGAHVLDHALATAWTGGVEWIVRLLPASSSPLTERSCASMDPGTPQRTGRSSPGVTDGLHTH